MSTGSTTTLPDPSAPAPVSPGPMTPGPVESGLVESGLVESAPACPPAGVLVRTDGGDAAMGLRVLGISLENCGSAPYRVHGYPAVRALDEKRAVLPVRALRGITDITIAIPDHTGAPRPVTLQPGEHARAVVVWRNTYDDPTHPPVEARFLQVAPAAGRPAQILAPQSGLDLGSTGRLGVSPWRRSPQAVESTSSRPPTAPVASAPPLP